MIASRGRLVAVLAVSAGLLLLAVGGALVAFWPWAGERTPSPEKTTSGTAVAGSVTVLAAGDIGRCGSNVDEATAEILQQFPDATVLALGDLAYENGSAKDFERCYDPSWGPFKERTRPVPGNHEYRTAEAAAYFDYFGSRAGEPGKGWYSFDLGEWHIVALNSNCEAVGCHKDSEQERWLRADLEANDTRCTLAFWHHPRFSSGAEHGDSRKVAALWRALLDGKVDLVLSGHDHLYERTAPLDAKGNVDAANGVRQFVVGTGGGKFYELGDRIPGSEAAIVDTAGLLKMTLQAGGYDWSFVTVGNDETDAGSAECR